MRVRLQKGSEGLHRGHGVSEGSSQSSEFELLGLWWRSEFLTTDGIAQRGDSLGAVSANGLGRLSGGAADAIGIFRNYDVTSLARA